MGGDQKAMSDSSSRGTFVIKKTYNSEIQDVWDLWTTKDGIESWWGPDKFVVTVESLDFRPGGSLLYTMKPIDTDMAAGMKRAGMPVESRLKITFLEIETLRRINYFSAIDFVPDAAPYDVTTIVEFKMVGGQVHMTVTCDTMHDDVWTERARAGRTSELGKLDKILMRTLPNS